MSRLLDLAAQEAALYCTDIMSGLPVPFCAICRVWTLYAFKTGSQLTAVQSFNLYVNVFFCYRQVDMAVGFGAIRRPVSEDLIVSCYYFIRKYTVINAVLIFLVHPRNLWRKASWRRSDRPVVVRQFHCQLPVRAETRADSSRQCKLTSTSHGWKGGILRTSMCELRETENNHEFNMNCKRKEPLTVHPKMWS
jgi:hypothetical protein